MSNVDNYILTFSAGEPRDFEGSLLILPIDDGREVRFKMAESAGPKFLECFVYVATTNHMDPERVANAVAIADWRYPTCVQLWHKGQEDDLFSPLIGRWH